MLYHSIIILYTTCNHNYFLLVFFFNGLNLRVHVFFVFKLIMFFICYLSTTYVLYAYLSSLKVCRENDFFFHFCFFFFFYLRIFILLLLKTLNIISRFLLKPKLHSSILSFFVSGSLVSVCDSELSQSSDLLERKKKK